MTTTPEGDQFSQTVIQAMMRAAIPTDDIGSRGAIQYAQEMAEFLVSFGFVLRPLPGRDPSAIKVALDYMNEVDPPSSV